MIWWNGLGIKEEDVNDVVRYKKWPKVGLVRRFLYFFPIRISIVKKKFMNSS